LLDVTTRARFSAKVKPPPLRLMDQPHQSVAADQATARTIRRVDELVDARLVAGDDTKALQAVADRFSIAITPAMAELSTGADDPVGRQFVPQAAELRITPDERPDPIGDVVHEAAPGVTHRYADRVLLKPVMTCAVYCRFCFRRETVGDGSQSLNPQQLAEAVDYIRRTPTIWEVILTGGDPLVMSPRRLRDILEQLATIEHVMVVRVHTRIPVVDPERITAELMNALTSTRLTPWLVLHTNHVNELTPEARSACARVIDAGVPMLGQTVLLRGVNDSADALSALFRQLIVLRIKPYYLHHADLAAGTSHFRTDIETGQELMTTLRATISGICQPTYVLDIPGGYGKVPIGPTYLTRTDQGWQVTDIAGAEHDYSDGRETSEADG
jgi:lysine 2,3-aminomutase